MSINHRLPYHNVVHNYRTTSRTRHPLDQPAAAAEDGDDTDYEIDKQLAVFGADEGNDVGKSGVVLGPRIRRMVGNHSTDKNIGDPRRRHVTSLPAAEAAGRDSVAHRHRKRLVN